VKLADRITRDTAGYNPACQHYPGGDVTIVWPRTDRYGACVSIGLLADLSGLDPELFCRDSRAISLHIPAEIAASE
jgi:hypothetical protein